MFVIKILVYNEVNRKLAAFLFLSFLLIFFFFMFKHLAPILYIASSWLIVKVVQTGIVNKYNSMD